MKKGWQTKQLGELAELKGRIGWRGLTAKEYTKEGPLFLSVHSLNYGDYVDFRDAFHISEERYFESPEIMLQPNDVLICKDGAGIGKLGILGELPDRATINSSLLLIRSGKHILPKYLYRCLTSPYFQDIVQSRLNGATTPHLYQRDITEFPVVLPPLAEQQRIVGLLDEAFEGLATAKANAEKNLQNARALFESHLQSVFTQRGPGWVENKLKSITTKIGSGATPRGGEESYKAEGISLIRSLNVHDLGFKYAKLAFLDDAQADELSNVEVQPRDVLLNITGASVARCANVPDDVLPARVNQHVSIIRPIAEKLDADFLHYLLISKPYKDQLLKTGEEGGSTRQAITKAQIQEFTVEYPAALKEQNAIVAKLDAMLAETQRLARLYERKLAALEALKKSLLHQAFTGEL
ncbi:MAG: restriction endonuclease subunit S [Kiritimatiellales bacterium]|nr:restriction endonuclease subunit S [Kiritimatiellales bacterium]